MARHFKDSRLQAVYDTFRKTPPTAVHGACSSAYLLGYRGGSPLRVVRGTLAYAAYAAGVDNAKGNA